MYVTIQMWHCLDWSSSRDTMLSWRSILFAELDHGIVTVYRAHHPILFPGRVIRRVVDYMLGGVLVRFAVEWALNSRTVYEVVSGKIPNNVSVPLVSGAKVLLHHL
jgi:hypothetical protein